MTVKVDNGKYEFSTAPGSLDIRRHGEAWVTLHDGVNAIRALIAELDAARVVVKAARDLHHSAPPEIRAALKKHAELVDDQEDPSDWAML